MAQRGVGLPTAKALAYASRGQADARQPLPSLGEIVGTHPVTGWGFP